MSNVFGGGLDTQSGTPAYSGDNSGTLPDPPASQAPVPQPQNSTPSFGSSLLNLLPGPHYTPLDPQESALDQSASLLQQRITRAGSIATNPLAQFFAPEQVQAARAFVPQATEQLQKIQTQKAAIQAGRTQAQQLGLTPDEAPDQATQDDRLQVASVKALNGDLKAFQGIQAIAPDRAAAIAPQVYAKIGSHLDNAQTAFDSLSGMENQGQYQAKINQLRQDGTLTDLEGAGLKLPPTLDAFKAAAPSEALALRNARVAINAQGQQMEQRNTYVPMETKEQDTYKGALKTVYGDELNLGPWSRNGATGTRGQLANGIATVDDYGKTGSAATADQRTQIGKDFETAASKQDVEKYRAFNRIYQLATTDAKGNPVGADKINTNPNVQQGISEGMASLLRGGQGGANVGLLKIELGKRGWSQSAIDGLVTNYAGVINTLFANADKPYLSRQTQGQIRDVMDALKTYNDSNITDRALGVAQRAGALGLGPDALGLGKDEATGAVSGALEAGRQAQIERMRPYFQPIGAGNGVLQLGAQRPGAGQVSLPPGAQSANQLPGTQPLLTPVQQATQNGGVSGVSPQRPAPSSSAPPGGAGQPSASVQPVTVAGQQVTMALPAGASPAYVNSLQRIETGGQKNPWTTTAQGSSAGGAYGFIKTTWDANKPPGAPARAVDATPEQQTAALEKLTNTNATALQTSGVPVNDTNLYVAHNLGAGGAASLLKANPNADARSIVGEAAARNNPTFFKGRPTVATVIGRYQANVAQDISDSVPRGAAPLPGASSSQPAAGNPMDDPAAIAWNNLTPAQQEEGRKGGVDMLAGAAPAATSTVGAIAGGAIGGPPGAVVGGAVGGGAGQALKDYLRGNPQSAAEIVKQTALGGALGVASAARPVVAAAGRVVGSGAIEAGSEAAQGASGPDVVDAGLRGMAEGAGGEAFGRALGMAGHKVFSLFAPDAKAAVQGAAKAYADSSKILETEPNRLPGVGGAASGPNPKYDAAQVAKDKAETTLKDAGLDPEEAAYAHKVSSEGVPVQEAQASKPGALEQKNIGLGYQQLETEVGAKGVGAPKAAPKLADGPIAAVENKQVSAKYGELAQRTEAAITAPAQDWQQKWTQLQDVRSNLLQAERDALGSTAIGKTQAAADMRTLADTVRTQQAKAANYVFGPQQGPQVMQRLNALDVRYRRLMDATNGGDLAQAARLKGADGRVADQKFRAFAAGDPTAIAAWNAMRRGAGSPNYEKGVYNLVAAEQIPVLGKVVSGVKLLGSFNRWMQERAAGSPAKFSDILNAAPDRTARNVRDVVGTAAQRGAVQGDVLNGADLNPISSAHAAEPNVLQITPAIAARMQRRLQNAQSDEETQRVIKDAAKYGVDWSHYGSR